MPDGVECVLWSSTLFGRSGYAEEVRSTVLALDRAGVPVRVNPLYWQPWQTDLPAAMRERLEALVAIEPPSRFVHVQHYGPNRYRRHPAAVLDIGRAMCETEAIPPDWVPRCNAMDEIWVPSAFNIETFARCGVAREKLQALPECLMPEHYDPSVPPLEIAGARGFVFLSVFAWSRRKGWDVLVRAYVEEFAAPEEVTLVLKVTATYGSPTSDRVRELATFIREDLGRDPAACPRILILDADPGVAGMPGLYGAADAFVLPSRGEGWGRPYMEAMAMGLPTIGTRWSGNLAFMNDDNSYLIDCRLVDVAEVGRREGEWWKRSRYIHGERWAEPSVTHVRKLMRHVFEDREEARARGARARAHVLAECSPERVARVIVGRLEALGALPERC